MYCPKCFRKDLEPSDFHKDPTRPNGLTAKCKRCKRAYDQVRRSTPEEPAIYLIDHFRKGRAAFGKNTRKRYDFLERMGHWVLVNVGQKIYRWNRWRIPAYVSMTELMVKNVDLGMEIREDDR